MRSRDVEVEGKADALRALAQCVERALEPGEPHRRLGALWALRSLAPTAPQAALYTPMLCVIAQGAKQILVGDERLVYDPGRFLLNTVAVPAAGGVIEASPERPCLWVTVELDPSLVAEVVLESGRGQSPSGEAPQRAIEASTIDLPTLDAVVRLARLFDTPSDAEFLAPLLMREIVYRLLAGNQASRLRQIASPGGQTHLVLKAVEWLRRNFDQPMTIAALAAECGLSPSALHHHFKALTAMSPLRYQKQLRLQEAKRLMLGEGLDAARAGQRVGYDDPSYFSREYRRFFGDPPRRDATRTRCEAASAERPSARTPAARGGR